MFGIDQISWGQFIRGILLLLSLWYLTLFLWFLFNKKRANQKTLFKDDFAGTLQSEELQAVGVSSRDLPSEMVPLVPFGAVVLPVSFYEEIGVDDGYPLDRFQNSKNPLPSSVMEQIQFQQ
ncbi:hypothetical protein [Sunxiuqinia dokdonensis]|uniref:Uncharacterized protein n=1 Tax=Sunxiuqinia dokdonensis TaxID=1409788 RepID=A0A0L8V5F9_9BACT|nr:hypothetical protein [Sunxiuqinia dokdonensis]KOH43656.1 hypothetical protein NC99_35760 [Sunxiuqinia dokdonensis]